MPLEVFGYFCIVGAIMLALCMPYQYYLYLQEVKKEREENLRRSSGVEGVRS